MLTIQDLERAAKDERWLGFGYLGSRQNALTSTDPEVPAQPLLVAAVDQRVIDHGNVEGWDYEDLFVWANSRNGRYFADVMFGSHTRVDRDFDKALGWSLLEVPA